MKEVCIIGLKDEKEEVLEEQEREEFLRFKRILVVREKLQLF
ncbi:MAG: hypothetical protein QMD36_03180 [Candidatus Aenigmarchaeota archaeon]|nr:hypothetical protein [Candidatus Aenigmarchaeota archaeon]